MGYSKDNSRVAKLAAEEALTQAQRAELAANSVEDVIAESEQVTLDNKIIPLTTVDTVTLRDSTYPNPLNGSLVTVNQGANGNAETYRFVTGTGWVLVDKYNGTTVSNITAQLAEKATKTELSNVLDGTPKGTYATLAALQTAYPTGATGVYIVTADGHIYSWSGTAWVDRGLYQAVGIAVNSILARHEQSNYTPVVKTQSEYTSNASATSLYIPNITLSKGLVNVTFSANTTASGFLYFLERIGTTTSFVVVDKLAYTPTIGENNIKTSFTSKGNGQEYIGFIGFVMKFKATGSVTGFFEKSAYDNSTTPVVATDKTTQTLDFSLYTTYSDVIVLEKISSLKTSVDLLSVPKASKSLNALKFRETTGNSTIFANAYFQGRWFIKNIGGVDHICTINAGSEIYAKFTGTTISGTFVDNSTLSAPYIAVSIDGGSFTRILIAGGSVVLASGLDDKEHYIRVMSDGVRQDDDVWVGGEGLAFKEFTVGAGKTIKAIKPLNKVGQYIGDSITAGIRSLTASSSPGGSSAEKAFPFIACNQLNSACVRVGFGSTGVSTVGAGGVPVTITYVDYVKEGILESAEKPDYIVINHGTNDNEIDSPTFLVAYRALIKRLNIKYPGIVIVCMRPFSGSHASDISTIVAEFSNCFYVDTSAWAITYNDGVHPDIAGHQVAGMNLASELKKIFGLGYFIP